MNEIIKEQLKLLKVAELSEFDDNTTEITIPKQEAKEYNINIGKCYLIELENYIINPPETFTLHINWNNNIIPKDKYMKVEIVGIMGKMVKVNGVGYDFVNKLDLNTMWEGWLPRKAITIIKEL